MIKIKFGWWYIDFLMGIYEEKAMTHDARYDCFEIFEREYRKQVDDFADLIDEIIPAFADSKWEDSILFKVADKIFSIFHKVGLIKV
jgi:hypothetical protein